MSDPYCTRSAGINKDDIPNNKLKLGINKRKAAAVLKRTPNKNVCLVSFVAQNFVLVSTAETFNTGYISV